jgi:hypothetical protein
MQPNSRLMSAVSLVFVNVLKPNSPGATAFIAAWLVLPYAALALALAFFARERASAIAYVIFLHPDPQGGIAVLFTPIYQTIGIGFLVPTCRWSIGKSSA